MQLKFTHYANIALVIALIHDLKVNRRNRAKFQELVESHDILVDQLNLSQDQVKFLLSIINKDHSNVDEFDKIALHTLNFEMKDKE